MLAVYTEEQNMLDDAVKKFARDYGLNSPADLKVVDRTAGWKALSEMGLAGLRTRDSSGAPMASAVEIARVRSAPLWSLVETIACSATMKSVPDGVIDRPNSAPWQSQE